jgi:hypothetical protein
MLDWRFRAQLRRRARRRYLAVVHSRWRAAGAPRTHGQVSQVVVTLLWLVAPILLAALLAVGLWMFETPGAHVAMRPEISLVLLPLLALWLLRMLRR